MIEYRDASHTLHLGQLAKLFDVGYARAVSDGAFNAYVSTVAVLPAYRRQGIGREMMRRLLDGRDQVQFVLHARAEVHPFYLACGFSPAPDMLRRDRKY